MCRNITELRGLQPAATDEEIDAAARQYVRKVSGITRPSAANADAFEAAVAEVTAVTARCCRPAAAAQAAAEDGAAAASSGSAGPAQGMTTLALKEWSAAVHALLDGRQTVLLRKGGIGEKRFEVAAERFLLFPTVAHSHAERVRPEHRDLLAPAAADSDDGHIVVRAGAKVVAAVAVSNPEGLADIEPLHIWTDASVREDRLDFRPRHRLTVLVVQACPLTELGAAGPHRRTTPAAPAGWTCPCPGLGRAGARRRRATTESPTGSAAPSADGRLASRRQNQARGSAGAVVHGVGRRNQPLRGDRRLAGAEIAAEPRMSAAGDEQPDSRSRRGNGGRSASSSMRTGPGSAVAVRRRYPSLTLRERPRSSTSLIRTNKSTCGMSAACDSSTTGLPTTYRSTARAST